MSDFEFEDAELINGFREESLEHIEVVETKLLDLESVGFNASDINEIFRSIHTIKGGSGFLGFEAVKELSHRMESLLDMIRNGKREMTGEAADVLLRGTDLLKAMMNDLANQDDVPMAQELATLEALINGETPAAATPAATAPAAAPEPEPEPIPEVAATTGGKPLITKEEVDGLFAKGFNLYRLPFSKDGNREKKQKKNFDTFAAYLNSFGCLVWEDGQLEQDGESAAEIIFATVLDPDFASASLRVTPEDLTKLTKDDAQSIFASPAPAAPAPTAAQPAAPQPAAPEQAPPKAAEKAAAPAPAAAKPAAKPAPAPPAKSKSAPAAAQQATSVRVNTALLNKLMNLAGELILSRNQLVQKLDNKDLPELQSLNQRLSELQESVMQTRLQQVGAVFNKVPRLVRDLSRSLGKQIEVVIDGADVELDRTIIDSITDPLTHLVRNSIDHGIEMPDDRLKSGKTAHGTLALRAYHEGGQVNLEIRDDGKGIDQEIIKRKALEKGVVTGAELETMGKREALNLIFRPGFSTAQEITDISGRGVGMDVVKTTFEKLGGTVDLNSDAGKGTTILVKLPTTLAIVSAVIVEAENQDFAIPQTNIEEIVRLKENEVSTKLERVGRYEIYRLRGKLLPIIRLADILDLKRTFVDKDGVVREDRRRNLSDRRAREKDIPDEVTKRRSGEDRRQQGRTLYIVVLRVGVNQYGLLVNSIRDVEEVVVKPLSNFIKDIKCYHGTTILGDGRVIMILDCNGISNMAKLKFDTLQDMSDVEHLASHAENQESQSFLLFNNASDENFAIPLSFITRIEKVDSENIEMMGNEETIQVGGKNVPLFRLERRIQCKKGEISEDGQFYLLIPNMVRSPYAIVATRVQDVVTTTVDVQTDVLKQEGVLGTSIINDKLTLMLDIYGLFDERRETNVFSDKKRSILLAEDTPFFRTMIRTYLEEHGFDVLEAVNGAEAWDILQQESNPDLVLSDIEMPIMNGYELVTKIKTNEKYNHLPVMAITALDNPQAMAMGEQAGFDAYQVKLDRDQLIKTIEELLSFAAQSA